MPCALCTDPALCTNVCRAFEFAPAAVRSELLRQCAASGQMDSRQVAAHVEAGEMGYPPPAPCPRYGKCTYPECEHFMDATPLPTYHQQEKL